MRDYGLRNDFSAISTRILKIDLSEFKNLFACIRHGFLRAARDNCHATHRVSILDVKNGVHCLSEVVWQQQNAT
jgi:hypothetical protein